MLLLYLLHNATTYIITITLFLQNIKSLPLDKVTTWSWSLRNACSVLPSIDRPIFPIAEGIQHLVSPLSSFGGTSKPRRQTCSSSSWGRRPRWPLSGSSPTSSWQTPGRTRSPVLDQWIQLIHQKTGIKNLILN